MVELEKKSAIPLYRQVKEKIRIDYIDASTDDSRTAIPSEQELMREYGVSRITVRNAVSELVKEGLLEKHQGKGTFVTKLRAYPMNSGGGFSTTCALLHLKQSTKLIDMREVPATEEDQAIFALKRGEKVLRIKRLRLGDDVPYILEHIYMPLRFGYLTKEDLEHSLYKALEKECGPVINTGPHWIEIHRAYGDDAAQLQLEEGSVVIMLQEYGYDKQQTPLHRTRLILRSDFRFYLK